MRLFKQAIFFGGSSNSHIDLPGVMENGRMFSPNEQEGRKSQKKHIEHLCGLLHKSLDEALEDLSGAQQPAHPSSAKEYQLECEAQDKSLEMRMAVVADIATALGLTVRCADDEKRFALEVERERWKNRV